MPTVMTVRGPIDADELGVVQALEHLLLNIEWPASRWSLDGILQDERLAVEELRAFRAAGGRSIVDLTNIGMRRDPVGVRRISEATDVHVVLGCGWYRQPHYPPEALIDRSSTAALASQLVHEIEHGLDGTDVRPGIVGEIGSHKDFVSAQEERVFRAAGRAAARTGLAVSTHSVASPVGREHLRILIEEGVDPRRVAIGHADSYLQLDYLEALLREGAWVQFDNIGYRLPMVAALESRLTDAIVTLIQHGWVGQLLLSQDVCHRSHLKAYGGQGYDYLLTTFIPRLEAAGVSAEASQRMLVDNPRRLLTGE
ncbi:MAG: phosphotriesterase [Chloroflexi bacterium]|nr:phosphotriesterase [Chloroflexota bacterium]